jgi:hypothetical protein
MHEETALLFHCASWFLNPGPEADIGETLSWEIDWQKFLSLVTRHRAVFPVFRCLSRLSFGHVPAAVLERLRGIQLRTLTFNLQAARELIEVGRALEEVGRPVIAYKGPLLAAEAYGDLAGRQFTDLDILVHPEDMGPVRDCLAGLGYGLAGGFVDFSSGLIVRFLRDVVFFNSRGRLPLEVQWRLAQGYHPVFPKMDELWSRSRRATLEGAKLRTFCPEDTLLILCLHGLYHAWEHLQMVTDTAAVIQNMKPDWERTLDLARENRAERILFLGLLLANRMLSVKLPEWVLDRASSDRVAAAAAEDSIRRFFQPEDWTDKARRFFFREVGMFPGPVNKARYFIGRLLTPNEEDLAGQSLTWLRLFILPWLRLIRLFGKYII